MSPTDRQMNFLEGTVWIAIGMVLCFLAMSFDLGSFQEPGPGFVAFLSGLAISTTGLLMIISKALLKKKPSLSIQAISPFQNISWRRLTYTVGILFGYTSLLNTLGYVLATLLLMWAMSYDWKKKNWTSSALFSSMTVIVSYLIFEVWLQCQLPQGILLTW